MAFVRCKPRTYLRIGPEKPSFRTASHGIGCHFRGRVDAEHSELPVQFQFEHTAVHQSAGIGADNVDIFDESVENNAARRKVLAAANLGEC